MKIAKDDFYQELDRLKEYLTEAINEKSYSKIVIYYNHYYNFSKSEFTLIIFSIQFPFL